MDNDQWNNQCDQRIDELVGKHVPLFQVNNLMLLNAILMLVVVGVGVYAPRYRHHPLIGFIFLGATTLFLPIVSYVASSTGNMVGCSSSLTDLHVIMSCTWGLRVVLVEIWTGLVLITGINTSPIVAADAREGRNSNPPTELFIKAFWLAYLTLSTPGSTYGLLADGAGNLRRVEAVGVVVQLFVIIFAKLLLKFSAFYKARRSFALGRSPRLVAGYMAQLQKLATTPRSHTDDENEQQLDNDAHANTPPALLVLGEDTMNVEEEPHGYSFTKNMVPHQQLGSGAPRTKLVTLQSVWRLPSEGNDMLLRSQHSKDLCFSFALFKLLRCRFANYTASEAGFADTRSFFRDMLLRGDEYERVFRLISDELSFIHDYYYSSLPISYSHHLFPVLSIALSLFTIGYSLYLAQFIIRAILEDNLGFMCLVWCETTAVRPGSNKATVSMGWSYDVGALGLVLAVLLLAETRDIVSYICSNWTKVAVICHYVNQPSSWQQSPAAQKRIGFLLECCRSKLVNSWVDKMNQCSILVLHPRKISIHARNLFRLPNQKNVKVPGAVKEAVFQALKCQTSEQVLEHIRPPSHPIPGENSESSVPVRGGRETAHTILVWHIATSVVEASRPPQPPERRHSIAAIHLSRYCAYLVAFCPELLPGDDVWCRKLYSDVKKDAGRVRAEPETTSHQQLVELLSADPNHEVLKIGARLGKQLTDSATGWEALARFWSEMALYVAPSENLEGHADAIARGGELITLLWTLLAHAGIVSRLDSAAAAAATTSAAAAAASAPADDV
ncbi:unnamed protein product [Urochloa decumbens]|uniref:DUF4220 domain-containing protein n=1 Tax=Urochloa decumbens TaxID=240449 RepID=A0ABC9FMW7_9POAL